MRSTARIHNTKGEHVAEVSSAKHQASIRIDPKASGFGSSVSGGELLMLALATCYCNDVYREAIHMGIEVSAVDVECEADFPAEGAAAQDITFTARITAKAEPAQIQELARRADERAEIQNTVRSAIPARLTHVEAQAA